MASLMTHGPDVRALRAALSLQSVLVLGYRLLSSARPTSSCFGGGKTAWDGLTVLCFFHCFCCFSAVTQVTVETLCGAHVHVLALLGTCVGFLRSFTWERRLWLTSVHPHSASMATLPAVSELPAFSCRAGALLACESGGSRRSVDTVGRVSHLVSPEEGIWWVFCL